MIAAHPSISEGSRRYHAGVRRYLRKKKESKTLHGRSLYKHLILRLNKHFKTTAKAAKKGQAGLHAATLALVTDLKPQLVSHLALTTTLDSLSVPSKRTALANQVGRVLIEERDFSKLKTTNKKWWKTLHSKILRRSSYRFRRNLGVRAANQDLGANWREPVAPEQVIRLGMLMLELIRSSTGLIQYEKRKLGRHKTVFYVVPTEETVKWVNLFHKRVASSVPYYLPVNEIPPDWTDPETGGYEFPSEINWHFIKNTKSGTRQQRDKYNSSSLSEAFLAANRLQSVPLRVSSSCLSVICQLEEREKESCLSVEPKDTAGYRRSQALIHSRLRKALPKILQRASLLHRAKSSKDSSLYFPVQADFRGRLYYVPKIFNPQGPDLAKGLLEFEESRKVAGSEHWFLIGGANRYGIKGSFEDRQEWAIKHEKYIRAVANDPIGNKSFWQESECPTEFLQWCFEFGEWMKNRITFRSRLPVKLDHTASGLQIISLLEGDKELQRLTNLTDNKEPVDLYSLLLEIMRGKLIQSGRPESLTWLSLGLNRSVIKALTVMFMYGGTPHGMQQSIVSWYVTIDGDPFGRTIYNEIANLLICYHEALDELSPTPRRFMKECRDMIKPDEILSWVSPSGFPVTNIYHQTKSTRCRTTIDGERISFHVTKDTNKLATGRAKNAIAANKVHSYDAALLHKTVGNFEEPIVALHDCYGVHPSNCDTLRKLAQTAICDVFGVDTPKGWCYFLS